jgi:Bacterial TSP3 repeat
MHSEQTPQDAYNEVVADVGSNRVVANSSGDFRQFRDSVDQRIINNLKQRTGRFLDGADLLWPTLVTGPLPTDADKDGMPDAWEQQHFGSTSRGGSLDSSSDFEGDGYTDLEEYLNQTDPRTRTQ